MKTSSHFSLVVAAFLCATATALAAPFGPGNIAVLRVGNGAAPLTANATDVFIDEYSPVGTLVQPIFINFLTLSGSATSEGGLMRSPDGQLLCFGGYQAPAGTVNVPNTPSSTFPRSIETVNVLGNTSLGVASPSFFRVGNIRSAATDGANHYWGGGSSSSAATEGINYFGNNPVVPGHLTGGSLRWVNIFNGHLFFSSGSTTPGTGIFRFDGTPFVPSALVGVAGAGNLSPYGFSINPADNVMYIADDRLLASGGGIQRWDKVGATWSQTYILGTAGTGGVRGLAVDWSGANPVIYATTTETANNRLIKVTDTGAGSVTATIAAAGVNKAFRGVAFGPVSSPIVLTCPADINVPASTAAGTQVFYVGPPPTGGCTPPTGFCNPPSGSTFPIGLTTVNCSANDACGNTANCSFTVTVQPLAIPIGTEIFFNTTLIPPTNGMYVPPIPEPVPVSYGNGVVIRGIVHGGLESGQAPPPPGGQQTHAFGSTVTMDLSTDNGATFQMVSAPAAVQVLVISAGNNGAAATYQTEMLQLEITGGTFPPNIRLRESPTLPSTGQTTIRPVAGGAMISSHFNVSTELSTDGGQTWVPGPGLHNVELRKNPKLIPAIPAPTPILPPRNDKYVSPADFHAAYAAGIVIKDASHSFFTHGTVPPTSGNTQNHEFNSEVDMSLSTDGGATFQQVRVPGAVTVSVRNISLPGPEQTFDTEMIGLTIQGGGLPPGMMIRESPTEPSRGGTVEQLQPDGTYLIGSFFDIFTEVSLDGGQNWQAANAPIHVELRQNAPENSFPTPNLPPPAGEYVSPEQWHALYANGIIITNASHNRFLQNQPPPPPGGQQVHNFASTVDMMISMDGGATFSPVSAPVTVAAQLGSTPDDQGSTRYFDTEMLSFNITGGGLPVGVMVRESPTKASLGRTSQRTVAPDDYRNSSFFDIFTEVSLDGGQNWTPQISAPVHMGLQPAGAGPCVVSISCPPDMTVQAPSVVGVVVNYPAPVVNGNCPPISVQCNPAPGSIFFCGATIVTCSAVDIQGTVQICTFNVNVECPSAAVPAFFEHQDVLPPVNTVYISPAQWHALYAQGIIIRNVAHRKFTDHQPPPPPGGSQVHAFGSEVSFEISADGGQTFQPATAPAQVTVQVSSGGINGATRTFDTEMLQLDISGGNLPAGVMLRESPTLASTGQTHIRQVPGGFMIDSFFDIFTEVSLDGGASWSPAQQAGHVEMRNDPAAVPAVKEPTTLLPPPNDEYVSPDQWHALFAQGIIISNVSHKFFTDSHQPPTPGNSVVHSFNSVVDLQLSTDGGQTFQFVRATAPVQVSVANIGSSGQDGVMFDTEMLALDLQGLPNGLMIRESPTLPSRGGTAIAAAPIGDPDFDLLRIHSFFDIFVEVSLDGGQTWSPAQNGAVRMQLRKIAPEVPKPTPNLPPADGSYVSPEKWHALYANGIIITNASHDRFTQTQPPPPPGGNQVENFGSMVTGQISLNGGASFQPFSAPANVAVLVTSGLDSGATRFFDTEMLSLNIQGGSLPGGIMLRESPTKQSLGRTSVRTTPGDYRISSFFDIFTEVSLDGGATWSPTVTAPGTMGLGPNAPVAPVAILCPPNMTVAAAGAAGAVVNYPPPAVSGGCTPPTVVCTPPSGSTFPVGTTTVTCTASDSCGGVADCSFTVTVVRTRPFPTPNLPPLNGKYVSPAQWHALYAQGIIISNVTHRRFTQSFPPPQPGNTDTHTFGSQVNFQMSMGPGLPFQPVTVNANCTVRVTAGPPETVQTFQTEMLSLNLSGGSLPAGVMLRESPTRASLGQTRIIPMPGPTYQINSFFDVFTELSLDGGQTWSPSDAPGHMELRVDPAGAPTALAQPTINAGQPGFTLTSQLGLRYLLQYKRNLDDPSWTTLSTTPGNGQPLSLTDSTAAGERQRFYRVEVQEDDEQ